MLAIPEYFESALARGLNTAILGSWERSRAAGLNPFERNVPTPLEDRAFRARLEPRGEMVELFRHFTGRFAGVLEQLGAVSFVCDGEGYLLSRVGAAEALRRFDHVSVREGSSCDETVLGTNAPSLALVTREPVMVTADEHYSRLYHTAFCVAAPILDEERKPLGCLDITKFFDRNDVPPGARKELLQLAITISDAIRSELSLRKFGRLGTAAPRRGEAHVVPAGFATVPRELADGPRSAVIAPLDASRATFAQVVGRSPRLSEAVRLARSYSLKDANVLIQGETGTGKELLARAIHNEGRRAAGLFVAVNCAAIPVELAESELFGYERGAFTGARAEGQPGKFELAHEGTLFLDEIGTMSLETQSKILRVLQDKKFMHLGGVQEIQADVRIIAATNVDLRQLVREGRFREDLFYRLNVISIDLPPLRQRREDIPLLVDHFLKKYSEENDLPRRRMTTEALRPLVSYAWPGNVRELENVVERSVVLSSGPDVGIDLLPDHVVGRGTPVPRFEADPAASLFAIMEDCERRIIVDMLEKCGWNQTEAAERFHVPLSTLNQKIKRLNIEIKKKSNGHNHRE